VIIKGQARTRARQLAAHLLHADQNERIRVYECRGTLAQDVEGALIELEARGLAGRSQKPLYHASISPEAARPLSDRQVREAVDLLEERLGLHGQPRVVVLHRKNEREHVHVVWSRIVAASGNAASDSWNYRLHEQVSRELEERFGHTRIDNSQSMWTKPRSERGTKDYEHQQAERSGTPIDVVSAELTELWRMSRNGAEFRDLLTKAGYVLARGDRRVFVVIDRAGTIHSLARRIEGIDTKGLRQHMRDVPLEKLEGVAETRRGIEVQHARRKVESGFGAASREVAQRTTADRTPLHRTVRHANLNIRAIVSPETVTRARVVGASARTNLPKETDTKPLSNYRSARALLVAEYASKIAHALRHAKPSELAAILASLSAERAAALETLKSTNFFVGRARARKKRLPKPGSAPRLKCGYRYRGGTFRKT
jgi:hypothetical protein